MAYAIDLSPWSLRGPWHLTPLAQGVNNPVQRVDTPDGSYVLRVLHNYSASWNFDRLRFEQAVLAGLRDAGLPFAVPALIPTAQGELWATLVTEAGRAAFVTLTHLIPGTHPDTGDLDQALAAAEALAQLDTALAQLVLPDSSADSSAAMSWRSSGDLTRCHPLVPDPAMALAALPLPDDACSRLLLRYTWLRERIPELYTHLPAQLMHVDFHPTNVLMEGTRVTGVLDFEFCSRDVRVMDLTVALTWWPEGRFGTGQEWPILAALARGYARQVRLTPDEIAAVPTLFAFRAYTSLIHRLGRFRAGLSPLAEVIARAEAALAREEWLAANGARLVETLREANR